MKMQTWVDVMLTSSSKFEDYNVVLGPLAKLSMLKHTKYCSSFVYGNCNFQFKVVVDDMS